MWFSILYTLIIHAYGLGIRLVALWNPKAKALLQGRNNIPFDLEPLQQLNKPVLWYHCASVGEFEQAIPLIETLENDAPGYQPLITFYSPSGYAFAKKRYPHYTIAYLPNDTPAHVNYFLRKVRPHAAFFIKYEFWYNILKGCQTKNIPVFLVSGIFRSEQLFFKPYGGAFKRLLEPFTFLFVQDHASANLLSSIHINQHAITGDTRFDRVEKISHQPFNDAILTDFCTQTPSHFVAGSVWDSDIPVLEKILQALPNNTRIILAPHQIGHFNTHWIKEPIVFYSQYKNNTKARILILDTLGLLSAVYRIARISYVGGGFGKGLHNILEATVYRQPVLIGPRFEKFREAVDLVKLQAALPITTENAAEQTTLLWRQSHEKQPVLNDYFNTHTNVSEKIVVYLKRNKYL